MHFERAWFSWLHTFKFGAFKDAPNSLFNGDLRFEVAYSQNVGTLVFSGSTDWSSSCEALCDTQFELKKWVFGSNKTSFGILRWASIVPDTYETNVLWIWTHPHTSEKITRNISKTPRECFRLGMFWMLQAWSLIWPGNPFRKFTFLKRRVLHNPRTTL